MKILTAENLFLDARAKVEGSIRLYNRLKTLFPNSNMPILTSRIWREGMIAEMWGTIATQLSDKGINYLENWRQGKYL